MNIIYIITSIILILSYLLVKKKEEKLNIIYSIIISAIIFLAYNVFICIIMFFLDIKMTLLNLSIVNILFSIMPIYQIIKNKEKQEYYLDKVDLIAVIIILAVTITLIILNYGTNIEIKHGVTDAATHFFAADDFYKYSTLLVKENSDNVKWLGLSYLMPAAYINTGILFKMCANFVNEVYFVKIYFIFDMFIWILSGLLMYTFLAIGKENKKDKILAVIFTFFYILAYQMNSLFAGFSYLSFGLDIIIGILIVMKLKIKSQYKIALIFLLNVGIMFSYYYFAPVVFLAIFWDILRTNKKEGIRIFSFKNLCDILEALFIPGMLGIMYFVILPKIGSGPEGINYASALTIDGFIYENFITNILPYVLISEIFLIFNCVRKRESFLDKILLLSVLFWVIAFCGYKLELISSYYFYKIYYMLFIILVASSYEMVKVFTDQNKIAKILVYSLVAIYSSGILVSMKTKQNLFIFDIYSNNGAEIQSTYALVKEKEFELFEYYNENINTTNNDDTLWCFPQGNTGRDRWVYSITKNGYCLNEVLTNSKDVTIDTFVKKSKYKYFVLLKNDYNGEYDKIDEKVKQNNLKILIQNSAGMILEKKDLSE